MEEFSGKALWVALEWAWALLFGVVAYGAKMLSQTRQKAADMETRLTVAEKDLERLRHDHEASIENFSKRFDMVIVKLDELKDTVAETGKDLLERMLDERHR